MLDYIEKEELKLRNILLLPSSIHTLNYGEKYPILVNLRYMAEKTNSIVVEPHPNSHVNFEEISSIFLKDVKLFTLDLPSIEFPQDRIVTTPNSVFYNPKYFNIDQIKGIDDRRRFIDDEILSEGGRYAIGDGIVFFGYGGVRYESLGDKGTEVLISEEQSRLLDEAFEGNLKVIHIPAPIKFPGFERMQFSSNGRVPEHIDQYIGGPIMDRPGHCLVPIHKKYYENVQSFLPSQVDNIEIQYVPIDGHEYYYFNYPRDPEGIFYVEPILVESVLNQTGIDLASLKDKVVVLPKNTRLSKGRGGLKCRTNFIQLEY